MIFDPPEEFKFNRDFDENKNKNENGGESEDENKLKAENPWSNDDIDILNQSELSQYQEEKKKMKTIDDLDPDRAKIKRKKISDRSKL
jgi:hypothetical protein